VISSFSQAGGLVRSFQIVAAFRPPAFSQLQKASLCCLSAPNNSEMVMAHTDRSAESSKGERSRDGRAEWDRPALYRLNINEADTAQKEAQDGILGKGS
jgi:hypothetical protein